MAIYFGQNGDVELKRENLNSLLQSTLDPSDVNTSKKRFSIDGARRSIITGDRIEIATVDGSTLELVSGHSHPDVTAYAYVDQMGGIRLYDTFGASITGEVASAKALVTPSSSKAITVQTANSKFRHLATVKSFEISTSRDQIDLTSLGSQFKQQYEAGLVSGQGTLDCLWEHSTTLADNTNRTDPEFCFYLAQLAVRLEQGADFAGRFYLYKDPNVSANTVWYEANCVVTNVAINVEASAEINARIDFITNGAITLATGAAPSALLQEDQYKILQESGSPILLEQD